MLFGRHKPHDHLVLVSEILPAREKARKRPGGRTTNLLRPHYPQNWQRRQKKRAKPRMMKNPPKMILARRPQKRRPKVHPAKPARTRTRTRRAARTRLRTRRPALKTRFPVARKRLTRKNILI